MKNFLFIFFLAQVFSCKGQLITYTYPSPIISSGPSDFFGSNYNVLSSTFYGQYYALAHFDATNTTLGVGTGIFMTTGAIDNGFGPHGPNTLSGCTTVNGYPADMFLNNLYLPMQNGVFDMAKLEIEFIPLIDSLKIKYVFASDEYPYGAANFNDFFAVQLLKNDSVLDINIAALPSGHLTCINFVNNGFGNNGPCVHCEFYQENGDGSVSPYNTDNQFVQFDGFTRDTYVFADNLEVGTVYEMVMYLADVGDASIDSGVFIESCETCSFNVGVKEEILEGINFYPNPTSDKLFIDGGAGALYSIIDMQGKIFQKGTLLQNSQEISLDKLQTGIYFLQLTNGTSTKTEKLVVE